MFSKGLAAAVVMLADQEEFCRFDTSLVFVAVLLMISVAWWRLPTRPSSPTCTARSIGGAAAFETRAKELETAGDLDGAMRTLLTLWTEKGSSTAMTLAHELSQRHPAESFEKGCCCPLQQEGSRRVADVVASASAAAIPCPAADADAAAGTDTTSTLRTTAVAAAEPAAAVCTSRVLADADDEDDSGKAVAVNVTVEDKTVQRRSRFAVQGIPPVVRSHGDNSIGRTDGKREGKAMAAVVVTEEAPLGNTGENSSVDGVETTSTTTSTPASTTAKRTSTNTATTSLPWERGWQGPEGFKPPSTAAPSSSSVSKIISTGDAGSAATLEPAGGGGGSLPGEKSIVRRNFTVSQLNTFDGSSPAPKVRGGETKAAKARPIYIALRGEVYDASAGKNLYGPVSSACL